MTGWGQLVSDCSGIGGGGYLQVLDGVALAQGDLEDAEGGQMGGEPGQALLATASNPH